MDHKVISGLTIGSTALVVHKFFSFITGSSHFSNPLTEQTIENPEIPTSEINQIIEVLKQIRFEVFSSLSSKPKRLQKLQSKLLSKEYHKVCQVFGLTVSDLKCKIIAFSPHSEIIRKLASQIQIDIQSGRISEISLEIPDFLSPEKCLEILKEIYANAYQICEKMVLTLEKTIRIDSENFETKAALLESQSKLAKYSTFAKYNLTHLEAPSGVILQLAIQKHCENFSFQEKLLQIEAEFKGKTEFALNLIR